MSNNNKNTHYLVLQIALCDVFALQLEVMERVEKLRRRVTTNVAALFWLWFVRRDRLLSCRPTRERTVSSNIDVESDLVVRL